MSNVMTSFSSVCKSKNNELTFNWCSLRNDMRKVVVYASNILILASNHLQRGAVAAADVDQHIKPSKPRKNSSSFLVMITE
jgi:hypothetical protein